MWEDTGTDGPNPVSQLLGKNWERSFNCWGNGDVGSGHGFAQKKLKWQTVRVFCERKPASSDWEAGGVPIHRTAFAH
jgi:hypothetical protein